MIKELFGEPEKILFGVVFYIFGYFCIQRAQKMTFQIKKLEQNVFVCSFLALVALSLGSV